jgi:hypothetical protein
LNIIFIDWSVHNTSTTPSLKAAVAATNDFTAYSPIIKSLTQNLNQLLLPSIDEYNFLPGRI